MSSPRRPRRVSRRFLAAPRAAVALVVVVSAALAGALATPASTAVLTNPTGCVHGYRRGLDYFPDKATVGDAQNFTVTYHGSYKVLTVKVPFPGGSPQTYVLVQCGTPAPRLTGALAGAEVVSVPVRSLFAESTTELIPLVEIGETKALHGVGSEQYVYAKAVRQRFKDPGFVEFARSGAVDVERVLGAKPDVLLTAGTDSPAYAKLREAGLPVVAVAEYLEPSPLGQAEWAKLIATLFNQERRSQSVYSAVASAYRRLAALSASAPPSRRPLVMTGFEDSGTFYEKGGQSLTARLIADAGATSVWADNPERGPIMIDLEAELGRAASADVWIDGSQFWGSLADAQKDDPRYQGFRPFQTHQVWVPNRVKNANGGLDFFERGDARPDLVLADLIKVFHPDRLRDHHLVFYVRLPQR